MTNVLDLCKILIAIALVVASTSFAAGMIIGVIRSIPHWAVCFK